MKRSLGDKVMSIVATVILVFVCVNMENYHTNFGIIMAMFICLQMWWLEKGER